jgi:hypothetical protein
MFGEAIAALVLVWATKSIDKFTTMHCRSAQRNFGIKFSSTDSNLHCLQVGTVSFSAQLASTRWVPANTQK